MRIAYASVTSLLLAAIAPAAHAHAVLEQASPADGAVVTSPPEQLSLRFSESVEPKFSKIELVAAASGAVRTGAAVVDSDDHRVLRLQVPSPLGPGRYTVKWRVVTRDTHSTSGVFAFEVR